MFVSPSKLLGARARLTALVRSCEGEDLNTRQPSARSERYPAQSLRITLARGNVPGYGHPKGFYDAPTGSRPFGYTVWRDMVTQALKRDHKTDEEVVKEHAKFGVLWRLSALRTYTDRQYFGFCVSCGQSRRGSLVNTDHSICATCFPVNTRLRRFCRCCGAPFEARGKAIFGDCHQWLRAFRRDF